MAVKVRHKREASVAVIWSILGVMLSGMGLLASDLWQLQVRNQRGFDEVSRNQSVRRVRLPAVRGKIYDTNEECLADSVPNYCIAIYTEELRAPRSAVANTLELMHEIWVRVGRAPDIDYHDIQLHIALTPNEPLVLYHTLSDEELARWQAAFGQWSEQGKVPGLTHHDPLRNSQIAIETGELLKRRTSTAANTLELVYEISDRIGIPRAVTLQNIKDHIYARRPLPLLAWKNIDEQTKARWADSCSRLAGTGLYVETARTYPEGENLAHLIGYTLEADAISEEEGQRYHFDMRSIEGKKGLETTYNDLLEGEPGYTLVQIDVSGFHHLDLDTKQPQAGGDLVLTIDKNIQRFAVEALAMRQDGENPNEPVRGAVVILNPDNGDVLALASSPSFDPNAYMASKSYRQALLQDPSLRAINRAVYGQYPPGSTFKPIVTLGVLRDYPDFGDTVYNCPGFLVVNGRTMRCNARYGHGDLTLRQALMHSCNVYMFEMAQAVGYDPIHYMARQMGIGQYAGLFPELDEPPQQKALVYGSLPDTAINNIDLANMSIGQGAITASPLQMAMVAATIANGGTLYRPRLVRKWRSAPGEEYNINPTWAIRRIDAPVEAFELVRGGMYDVVQDPDGTAPKARVNGVEIAGKTGSAQYSKLVDGEVVNSVHAWMISFAPFDSPRYAVAMVVEDGVSGGSTIAPRLSALYSKLLAYDGTLKREVAP